MPATIANALSLVLTTVGNTAANRRFTCLAHRNRAATRDHLGGLAAFGIALALTTSAIAAAHVVAPNASRMLELIALMIANLVATTVRFLLLRAWITPATSRRYRRIEPTPDSRAVPLVRRMS